MPGISRPPLSWRRRAAALVPAAVLGAALVTIGQPAAAAAPTAGGVYQLSVTISGKCIDVPAASTVDGAKLQQWGCTAGSTWQQFRVGSAGSNRFTLAGVNSGRCIDVPSGAATSGLQLQQWGCGNGQKTNQLWTFTPSGSGTYQITSVATGLCISDQGASTANGAAIIQETCTGNTNKQWLFTPVTPSGTTATVAADGTGTFRTVQAAVDAVPANNTSRATITIKAGTYREIVTVPANKPFITFQGLGGSPSDVLIVNNHNAGDFGTSGSASVFINGHDFIATNLTISNDFDENSPNTGAQAVALNLNADRSLLSNVRLLGDQDTFLLGASARSYIVNSYVQGTVDFIFGDGTAVFNNCEIHENPRGGAFTAARTPAARAYGFLIYRSRITGAAANGSTTLGRAWGPDAQVLFRESTLSAVVNTGQPWANLGSNDWHTARFSEYRNTGPGATVNANRAQLSDAQAPNYTPQRYLAGSDGWNPVG
ncbi:MAG TPA: pectinesterase family protein [Mycobacteriales bacterium]|nr:pectinesterase family protein [Mycobacteriales bacterium]